MRTFFFYDLETSGFNPRHDRIMQFAGQRTDMELNLMGEPVNILVKLTDEVLPSPGAIMTTHITPQKTLEDGVNEAEFCRTFLDEVATPDMVILGYNSVRFDDEHMRYTLWRNFHDPYEWSWSEGRSRWDLLDVTRFVRALRPDGIVWPTKNVLDEKTNKTVQVPTVNLVDMAKSNGFENKHAHDALADVYALIDLARLLRNKQPKMWQYLYSHRNKNDVTDIIQPGTLMPFVYTSGRYPSINEKTSVAVVLGQSKTPNNYLVWDLRYDPAEYATMSDNNIKKNLFADYKTRHESGFIALPVKELCTNKCPAVAPLGVLDEASQQRINLSLDEVKRNLTHLRKHRDFIKQLLIAWSDRPEYSGGKDVDGLLYDSFTPDADKPAIRAIAATDANALADFHPHFVDERLDELLLRYKARQYPSSLNEDERDKWEKYRTDRINKELPNYMRELSALATDAHNDSFILQELQLWAESIAPMDFYHMI